MIQELKASNESLSSMLAGQAEEMRDTKRMLKEHDHFRKEHDRFLKYHGETLRLHYRWIREMREKGR